MCWRWRCWLRMSSPMRIPWARGFSNYSLDQSQKRTHEQYLQRRVHFSFNKIKHLSCYLAQPFRDPYSLTTRKTNCTSNWISGRDSTAKELRPYDCETISSDKKKRHKKATSSTMEKNHLKNIFSCVKSHKWKKSASLSRHTLLNSLWKR